jgi:hypothetical protein
MDGSSINRPDARPRERFDLEPEPIPEPTVADVIEGITDALAAAIEKAEPQRSTARCMTILARLKAATAGYVDPDELLTALRMQAQEWRAS